jgi:hypothetical protein
MKLMIVFAMLAGCAFGQISLSYNDPSRVGVSVNGPKLKPPASAASIKSPIPARLTVEQFKAACAAEVCKDYAVSTGGVWSMTAVYGYNPAGVDKGSDRIPKGSVRPEADAAVKAFESGQPFRVLLPAPFPCEKCRGVGTVAEKRGTFSVKAKCPGCAGTGKITLPAVHEVTKK